MTTDELLDEKLAEGIEVLNQIMIRRMQEVVLIAGDLIDRPRVRAAIDGEHERLLAWRERALDEIEAALRASIGRLN